MRAVALDDAGTPALADVPEPDGPGELVAVLACGLCGSDVEKIGAAPAGTVLGHEVVVRLADGSRAALVHHLPCGSCPRCQAGHETTCERFAEPTIVPGGFAERVRARGGWVAVPDAVSDAAATAVEPLACVLRAAARVPRGRVLVAGLGFVGELFARVLERRGDDVVGLDPRPERQDRPRPGGPVDAAVVCAPCAGPDALAHVAPGGTLLVFADGGPLDLDAVYRAEITVTGARSATPASMAEAAALLPALGLPEPRVLPMERFGEALELYRSGAERKVVLVP